MQQTSEPTGTELPLFEFLKKNLLGSSLVVRNASPKQIHIGTDGILSLAVDVEESSKSITFQVVSDEWNRSVRVEELSGVGYMESRAEEDLVKLDLVNAAEDTLLAIDLLRLWGKKNDYSVVEKGKEAEATRVPEAGPSELSPPLLAKKKPTMASTKKAKARRDQTSRPKSR